MADSWGGLNTVEPLITHILSCPPTLVRGDFQTYTPWPEIEVLMGTLLLRTKLGS